MGLQIRLLNMDGEIKLLMKMIEDCLDKPELYEELCNLLVLTGKCVYTVQDINLNKKLFLDMNEAEVFAKTVSKHTGISTSIFTEEGDSCYCRTIVFPEDRM